MVQKQDQYAGLTEYPNYFHMLKKTLVSKNLSNTSIRIDGSKAGKIETLYFLCNLQIYFDKIFFLIL